MSKYNIISILTYHACLCHADRFEFRPEWKSASKKYELPLLSVFRIHFGE